MHIGDRFGSLVAQGGIQPIVDPSGRLRMMRTVRCDCGVEKAVREDGLRRGRIKSCGCSRKITTQKRIDLVGQRFGRWTVIERDGTVVSGNSAFSTWKAICDCGTTGIVRGVLLRSGHSRSCGCLMRELVSQRAKKRALSPGRAGRNDVLNSYKQSARMRGFVWKLSEQMFDSLIQSDCHYCGAPPSNTKKRPTFNGDFVYSGIDRKDNSQGYTEDNTVSCCYPCNLMKGKMSSEEFLAHVNRIWQFGIWKNHP